MGPFLCSGLTLAILSVLGNMDVLIIWLAIKVSGWMSCVRSDLMSDDEMSSCPVENFDFSRLMMRSMSVGSTVVNSKGGALFGARYSCMSCDVVGICDAILLPI